MACTLYQGRLFIANPLLKPKIGILDTHEKVSQLRSDLEKASEEAFKRINREKMECIIHARDKLYNGGYN